MARFESMLLAIFSVVIGLVMLTGGAELLVRFGSKLALRLGVSPLVVGLTIVAAGTSSPELVVSVEAALANNNAIAISNVVGSNIGNIALILGVAALISPMRAQGAIITRDTPIMIGATALLWLMARDGLLSRADGALLALGTLLYFGLLLWQEKRAGASAATSPATPDDSARKSPVWLQIVLMLVGLALLIIGAKLLIDGALFVARFYRVSEIVIGLTVVAIGTSLPELATSVVAALKKSSDVALGNAIGSNTLNIVLVLGATALIHPIPTAGIIAQDWLAAGGVAALLGALLWWRRAIERPTGALLLVGYGVYLWLRLH